MRTAFVSGIAFAWLALVTSGLSASFTVIQTGDDGPGSLRQAIMDANADTSADVAIIGFNIAGADVQTIAPLSGLPAITRPVTIDGYAQPGASPNSLSNADNAVLRIELTGASLSVRDYGLRIQAGGCTVRGLVIHTFTNGVAGILLEDSIGSVIEGNFIGTDPTGTNALNNDDGIYIHGESTGTRIGGTEPALRNVIGGCLSAGIDVAGGTHSVLGNFLGIGADGVTTVLNGYGVFLSDCFQSQIGGTDPGAGNVISGNNNGCWVSTGASNVIQGNRIGTDASGTLPRGNRAGIVIHETAFNLIGGESAAAANVIGANGLTVNDSGDADDGPNHLQNFPEIEFARLWSGDLTVRYRVDSTSANSPYPIRIEWFLADASGAGKTLIVRHTYGTPQLFTNVTFTPLAAVSDGDRMVATATDANGNTSEFSLAAIAAVNHPPVVASPIPEQNGSYGSPFSFTFAADAFTDPDVGQVLTYAATGLPAGVLFDGPTRTVHGTPTQSGTFSINIAATDDGTPALHTDSSFNLVLAKAALVVTANNKSKLPGQPNPALDGSLTGVVNADNITVSFITPANTASPAGTYPITPTFADPDHRLPNYAVTTNVGTLTIVSCSIAIGPAPLPDAASGGIAPYSFAVTSGALPGGVNLSSAGLISGTPADPGSSSFTVTATDAGGCTGSQAYSLTVSVPVYEGFVYPGGTLAGQNGGTGFSGAWSGASIFNILPGSILLGGPTAGGHLGTAGNGAITRRLAQPIGATGTVRYLSLLSQVVYPPFGPPPNLQGERVGLILNGTSGAGLFIGKPGVGGVNNWVLENAAGGSQVAGPTILPFVPSAQALLVVKCEFLAGNDRFTLYVNPSRGKPEPASGTVKSDIDLGSITNVSFFAAGTQTIWEFDEIQLVSTFAEAVPVPTNQAPMVVSAIPDQTGTYGVPFSFTFAANTFSDPDAGQTLAYAAGGLPPGVTFDGAARTFGGTNTDAGTFQVTVTATDNGAPALHVDATFNIVVGKATLTARALARTNNYGDFIFLTAFIDVDYSGFQFDDNFFSLRIPPSIGTTADGSSSAGTYPIHLTGGDDDHYNFTLQDGVLKLVPASLRVVGYNACRLPGEANPPSTGRLLGLLNDDAITATFSTTATPASPPDSYPITATLNDPNHRLSNYTVTHLPAELTVLPYGFALDIVHAFGATNAAGIVDTATRPAGAVLEVDGAFSPPPSLGARSTASKRMAAATVFSATSASPRPTRTT